MRIGLVQAVFPAGKLAENYKTITMFARQAQAAGVELLCFPELALTGYCRTTAKELDFAAVEKYVGAPPDKNAAGSEGTAPACAAGRGKTLLAVEFCNNLRILARQLKLALVFGAVEKAADKLYITTYICDRDGQIYKYRKTHPGKREAEVFAAGTELPVFTLAGGARVGVLSCSDNHYPEAAQTLALQGARLILAPFAVPGKFDEREKIWSKYLLARAYDNRVFLAAVNQLGLTAGGKTFAGGAVVYDPRGEIAAENFTGAPGLLVADINLAAAEKYWQPREDSRHNLCFPLVRKPELYK
jgi:predicted amidohydrolase